MRTFAVICAALTGLLAMPATGADIGAGAGLGTDASNVDIFMDVVLGLGVTILCIYLLSAAAKKLLGGSMQGAGALRVVTGISVGSRERLLIVQVENEQLLIGVSPSGISRLHQLETPVENPQTSSSAAPSFQASLTQLLGGGRS